VCRECAEESQRQEKTCFVCQRTYTEKSGPRGRRGDGREDEFASWLKGMVPNNAVADPEKTVTKENFAEHEDELQRKFREACAAKGIEMVE